MVLCLCHGVSDRKIREVVREGASTVGAIARATRAGSGCGSCVCDLKKILERERAAGAENELSLAAK